MSKYNCVFLGWWVPDFFPGLVAILYVFPWAGGSLFNQLHVPRDRVNPLSIVVAALTKGSLPELSLQVRAPSVLVYLPLVEQFFNAAMQVLS